MTTSRFRTLGLAALAVAGLTDIINSVLAFVDDSTERPPVFVLVTLIVTGLVSFAAYRGRGGLIAAYAARVVATLLGIPALVFDTPAYVVTLVTIGMVLSIVGVWLTAPALRRPTAART